MEFSIKLAGWVLNAPLKKNKKTNMVLKNTLFFLRSILKKTCFFPIMTPLTHPITHPRDRDCRDGDTKRGDVGLIKVKKQVDFFLNIPLANLFFGIKI